MDELSKTNALRVSASEILRTLNSSVSVSKPSPSTHASQPFTEGAESYLYGVLAAMSAGVCRFETLYKSVDIKAYETKLVAEFRTKSGGTVLVPIKLPNNGSIISDEWFAETRARISMECGE